MFKSLLLALEYRDLVLEFPVSVPRLIGVVAKICESAAVNATSSKKHTLASHCYGIGQSVIVTTVDRDISNVAWKAANVEDSASGGWIGQRARISPLTVGGDETRTNPDRWVVSYKVVCPVEVNSGISTDSGPL